MPPAPLAPTLEANISEQSKSEKGQNVTPRMSYKEIVHWCLIGALIGFLCILPEANKLLTSKDECFVTASALLYAWPQNEFLLSTIGGTTLDLRQQCVFFLDRSLLSLFLGFWTVISVLLAIKTKQRLISSQEFLLMYSFVFLLILLISFAGFVDRYDKYLLSRHDNLTFLLLKSYYLIFLVYYSFYGLCFHFVAWIYRHRKIRENRNA